MSDHSAPHNQNNINDLSGLSVGEILRRTRMHYGRSLDDVESVIRIRASLLEALEADDVSKLPGRVYAIGFIRSYAEYLGLDGGQIVELFKQQLGNNTLKPVYNFPVAAEESKRPDITVFAISLFGLVIVLTSYYLFKPTSRNAEETVKPAAQERIQNEEAIGDVSVAIENAEVDSAEPDVWPPKVEDVMPEMAALLENATTAEQAQAFDDVEKQIEATDADVVDITDTDAAAEEPVTLTEAEPAEEKTESKGDETIRIFAKDPTWLQIKDPEGKTIFTGILKRNRDIIVPEDAIGWRMDTGNAGGLIIYIGEEKLPPLGGNGIVVRRVPLFAQALRDRVD